MAPPRLKQKVLVRLLRYPDKPTQIIILVRITQINPFNANLLKMNISEGYGYGTYLTKKH
jgi:hypothetical protein